MTALIVILIWLIAGALSFIIDCWVDKQDVTLGELIKFSVMGFISVIIFMIVSITKVCKQFGKYYKSDKVVISFKPKS